MRLESLLPAAVVAISALVGCREDSRANARDAVLAKDVNAFAAALASKNAFSGAVLLSHNGTPLVRSGFGLANREKRHPNTPETAFMLSSVSKMFTAVAIARLVQQKRLSFESTLGTFLPEYPSAEAREQVTIRDLLTMSSGIPDLFRVPKFWDEIGSIRSSVDMWKYFANSPLQFDPGSGWAYSNSNFLLLGTILERVTGHEFPIVIQHEIFDPAGMHSTGYRVEPTRQTARGYTRDSGSSRWVPAWDDPIPGSEFIPGSAMGGGFSTVDDMARFAQAFLENRLVTPEMRARMLTGYIDNDYGGRDGLGFEIRSVKNVRSAGHRGSLAGSSSQVEFYPDLNYVVVVLGNTDSEGTQDIAKYARERIASLQESAK